MQNNSNIQFSKTTNLLVELAGICTKKWQNSLNLPVLRNIVNNV